MKLIQILIPTVFTLVIGCGGEQVNAAVNTPTIQCGMCQKTIEMGLKKVSGVTHSAVDLETKTTKVIFDKAKTDLSKIEKAISGLGYQANETLADPIAYEGLPGCCKIGGMH
jgi:copper chaperone CopZ|tara:strand:+ start:52 stop:387 length:336 start_codon:yes stop_codon:yes gene_type:complete